MAFKVDGRRCLNKHKPHIPGTSHIWMVCGMHWPPWNVILITPSCHSLFVDAAASASTQRDLLPTMHLRVVRNINSFERELSQYGYDVIHLQCSLPKALICTVATVFRMVK